MNDLEAKVIIALANNGLRAEAAAKTIPMHRKSLVYRVNKIYKETGLNAFDFHDMCWLLPKAEAIMGKYGDFVLNGGKKND